MTVIELWWLSLGIAAVVVVVVAVLLGLIIATAKSIDRHASAIWVEGKKIAGNTVSIWILEQVDRNVDQLNTTAKEIESRAASIDEKLRLLAGAARGRS